MTSSISGLYTANRDGRAIAEGACTPGIVCTVRSRSLIVGASTLESSTQPQEIGPRKRFQGDQSMSSQRDSFVSLAMAGEVMTDEIDDYVDLWHANPAGLTLHEYLGMNTDEYALWLDSPDTLPWILTSRKLNKP